MNRSFLLLYILILIFCAGVADVKASEVSASAMSNMPDRERLLNIAAGFASTDKRDAGILKELKKIQAAPSIPDSTVYQTILSYGRKMMGEGRQASVFDLFTQLTRVDVKDNKSKCYTHFMLGLYLIIGASADEIGMMNLGLEYYTRGLGIAEKSGEKKLQASFLNNIGVCYFKVKDIKKSNECFQKALVINKGLGVSSEVFLNYNNLAELDIANNNLDKALDTSLLALQQLNPGKPEDQGFYFYMQSNIGMLYTRMKKYDLAQSYLTNAMNHQRSIDNRPDLFETYLNLSNLYIATDRLDSAKYYADRARELTLSLENGLLTSRAMEQQAKVDDLTGDYKSSAELIRSALALRDSLSVEENRNRMEQCQRIYEIESANAGDESVMASWNPIVVFFVMFGIVVILVLILVKFFIYKRNRDKALAEKAALNREIQRVHEIQMQEAKRNREELQEALDLSHRQLTTFTMDKLRAKEIQNDITTDLRKLLLDINPRSKEVKENIQEIIRKLSRFNAGDDWTEFHYYFEKVHPSFYRRLMEKHPNITEKEKRLCAFLSLGLSSKEIASITFREVRSVESSRNRLRKKFELDADANLTDYCKEFAL